MYLRVTKDRYIMFQEAAVNFYVALEKCQIETHMAHEIMNIICEVGNTLNWGLIVDVQVRQTGTNIISETHFLCSFCFTWAAVINKVNCLSSIRITLNLICFLHVDVEDVQDLHDLMSLSLSYHENHIMMYQYIQTLVCGSHKETLVIYQLVVTIF